MKRKRKKNSLINRKRRTYHKAVESIADRMHSLGGPKTIAERQLRKYKQALASKDPKEIERYKSPGIWERTYSLGVRRADKEGVGPTIKEKMELESMKQTPTFGRIIQDNVIKKLFTEDDDGNEEEDEEEEEEDEGWKKKRKTVVH